MSSAQSVASSVKLPLSRIPPAASAPRPYSIRSAEGYLPGTLTYGWDAEETGEVTAKGTKLRRVKPHATEQDQLLRMVHLRAAGQTWYAIAKVLNADGIKTKTGSTWAGGAVRKLLNSRTVKDWLALRPNECG